MSRSVPRSEPPLGPLPELPPLNALSPKDVERLLAAPTAQTRIETMRKLFHDLEAGALTPAERSLAIEVVHCFAGDAQVAVREAVAWQLRNSPLLTEELAERLVRDVGRVAFPILRDAAGLTDDLLLDVLSDPDSGKHVAVANRARVSARVAGAIAERGNVVAVTALLRNDGAEVPDSAMSRALDRFGRVRMVSEAAAARPGLSLAMVERVVGFVSESMRTTLMQAHGLSRELVDRLVERGREAATMRLLRPVLRGAEDVDAVIQWLHTNRRLTPVLLFRSLCAGDLPLFVAGMAARAGIPVENARKLAWDDGELGMAALLKKASVAPGLLHPFQVAVAVVKRLDYDGAEEGREDFQSEVISDLFTACTPTNDWMVDDLLLQLFDQKSEAVIDRALDQAGLPFSPVRTTP
ncbi:DUF2336 domain-containing protein [Azospirillum picis]|uniref:Uncharacterized protein (DUF2336 family) n=1 Tax=Azospirillum picis TaxID=488438 RepID=A0ABU0MH53_9PROT|nr:DUF2336 domain-containing protein [Azospirillum picis]MBP2298988.1 uncharacterized protein (DUF2336 family) [Azospirillum picis]MDQ0532770.1 uncharacterized protein (DUF2336 family) [Azospirillum picis]